MRRHSADADGRQPYADAIEGALPAVIGQKQFANRLLSAVAGARGQQTDRTGPLYLILDFLKLDLPVRIYPPNSIVRCRWSTFHRQRLGTRPGSFSADLHPPYGPSISPPGICIRLLREHDPAREVPPLRRSPSPPAASESRGAK